MRAHNFIDMTGWKMWEHGVPESRLIVSEYAGTINGKSMWRCICSCEDKNEIVAAGSNIRNGNTLSCGCVHREKTKKANCTHQESKTRLYKIWSNIKSRCFTETTTEYENYGGRGITVCDEWKDSYEAFRDWAINNGYNDSLTIERINVNGNYCPENCKWATNIEQANNTRTNHFITYKDETHTLTEWSRILEIPRARLQYRINKMTVEEAFTKPFNNNTSGVIGVSWDNTYNKWMAIINIDKKTIRLGGYKNKEEAIKARLQAENEYSGNFVQQPHLYAEYGIETTQNN